MTETTTTTAPAPAPALAQLQAIARDAGAATAEYATCTVGATAFAGVLYKILTSPFTVGLVENIFRSVLRIF